MLAPACRVFLRNGAIFLHHNLSCAFLPCLMPFRAAQDKSPAYYSSFEVLYLPLMLHKVKTTKDLVGFRQPCAHLPLGFN